MEPDHDVRAAEGFIDHFGLRAGAPDEERLRELSAAFAALPYENLSKLVKKHHLPPGPQRRRLPLEVLQDHLRLGAGGTCFALTRLFRSVLMRLGLESFPVLCDTRHRPGNHCAIAVLVNGSLRLVDPGYLLHEPLQLQLEAGPSAGVGPGARLVAAEDQGRVADLYTFGRWRYRVRLEPVSRPRFEAAWDASFDWTMMNGVHLCVRRDTGYVYVNGIKLNLRTPEHRESTNIRGREPEVLSRQLGIDPQLVADAYRLVQDARIARRSEEGSPR